MRWLRYGCASLFLLMLAACSTVPQMTPYHIDTSLNSPNQDARVRTLVMHYTAANLPDTLKIFMDPGKEVSAHFVVADRPDSSGEYTVYEMVPTSRRAWHAGVSYWAGLRLLNPGSIGIEIVNLGFPADEQNLPLMARHWYAYSPGQIEVVAEIAKKIIAENQIKPTQIVGHSDIAPGRKTDPGPLFPWELLYKKYDIGAWPDDATVAYYAQYAPYDRDVLKLQQKLARYGYDIQRTGQLDAQTTDAITAFQMHFRSANYNGVPDIETVARLDALLEKYFKQPRPAPFPPAPLR